MIVTRKAMRPVSSQEQCFYCHQPIGQHHKDDCVLIQKKVKLQATIVYTYSVPAHWTKDDIEFHYNESTWCACNLIPVFQDMDCLCPVTTITYLQDESSAYLGEES